MKIESFHADEIIPQLAYRPMPAEHAHVVNGDPALNSKRSVDHHTVERDNRRNALLREIVRGVGHDATYTFVGRYSPQPEILNVYKNGELVATVEIDGLWRVFGKARIIVRSHRMLDTYCSAREERRTFRKIESAVALLRRIQPRSEEEKADARFAVAVAPYERAVQAAENLMPGDREIGSAVVALDNTGLWELRAFADANACDKLRGVVDRMIEARGKIVDAKTALAAFKQSQGRA